MLRDSSLITVAYRKRNNLEQKRFDALNRFLFFGVANSFFVFGVVKSFFNFGALNTNCIFGSFFFAVNKRSEL